MYVQLQVHFDGMGPTWSELVNVGIRDYPGATHGNYSTPLHSVTPYSFLCFIPNDRLMISYYRLISCCAALCVNAGILADADFMPMKDRLNKMELDVRCSKHMYTIWTEDHRNERKMDWIYRNIPGAIVRRRTHQILEVPELPDQEVIHTFTFRYSHYYHYHSIQTPAALSHLIC
jgi:hypothetical protein